MHLLYVDESGTSEIPGTTSHFILAGISIPVEYWKTFDKEIEVIKTKYGLNNKEMHVGWLLRKYLEQSKIADFETLSYNQRRSAVIRLRTIEILRLQKLRDNAQYFRTKKNYAKTNDYIHLSLDERTKFVEEVSRHVNQWGWVRLFADCIDKTHFDPILKGHNVDEEAFEQVISRFEHYLQNVAKKKPECCGLIIHDNNETVSLKHTALMRKFHFSGTEWLKLTHIIETPLFVDSQLTSMIQVADLCAYALRRYLENGEQKLFDLIIKRADKRTGAVVGVRHFTLQPCSCLICAQHKTTPSTSI